MRATERRGYIYSGLLHFIVLVLIFVGLPSFLTPEPPLEPSAIVVEMLPITGVTNVKPSEQVMEPEAKPEPKKEEPKPEPKKEETAPKPVPAAKKEESAPPPPPKPEEKPKEEKKEEPKPEPKKEEKKPKEEDLDAILKAVKDQAKKEESKDKPKPKPADEKPTDSKFQDKKSFSTNYNPDMPLSLSERDAIQSQVEKCWSVPAGAKEAEKLIVLIRAHYAQDGSLIRAAFAEEQKSQYFSNSFFRAAADSAMRAVHQCTPLQGLPPDKYATWNYIELRFDPSRMLN